MNTCRKFHMAIEERKCRIVFDAIKELDSADSKEGVGSWNITEYLKESQKAFHFFSNKDLNKKVKGALKYLVQADCIFESTHWIKRWKKRYKVWGCFK